MSARSLGNGEFIGAQQAAFSQRILALRLAHGLPFALALEVGEGGVLLLSLRGRLWRWLAAAGTRIQ